MSITLTLLGQAISFALFVLFCMKFVWPPLINALQERQKNISDGLEAADKAHKDLASAQESSTKLIQEGKDQAATIIANANKRAAEIVDEAKNQAEAEKHKIVAAAEEEINRSAQKARGELSDYLEDLVATGVGKIVEKEVDMDKHKAIIDDLGSQLKH